jgi:hypothetical protein
MLGDVIPAELDHCVGCAGLQAFRSGNGAPSDIKNLDELRLQPVDVLFRFGNATPPARPGYPLSGLQIANCKMEIAK